jgi:hypothetical protein
MKTRTGTSCVEDTACNKLDCKKSGRCIMNDEYYPDEEITYQCFCGDDESPNPSSECKKNPCDSTIEPNCHPEHTKSCIIKDYDVSCICKSPMYGGKYCDKINILCEANKCYNGATCYQTETGTCCYCDINSTGN